MAKKPDLSGAAAGVAAMTRKREAGAQDRAAHLAALRRETAAVLDLSPIPIERPAILPRPLWWRCVVAPLMESDRIAGSTLLKPDEAKDADKLFRRVGMLAAVGEAAFKSGRLSPDGRKPPEVFPAIGDFVLFGKAAGQRVKYRGAKPGEPEPEIVVLNDDDLLAIIDNPEDVKAYT